MQTVIAPEPAGKLGVLVVNEDVRVIPNTSVSRGDIIEFDFAQAAALNVTPGDPNSVFVRVTAPTANGELGGACHAVALHDISSGAVGFARIGGKVLAKVRRSGGGSAIVPGEALVIDRTNRCFNADFTAGYVYKAIMHSDYPTVNTSAALRTVILFGGPGIGSYISGSGGGHA